MKGSVLKSIVLVAALALPGLATATTGLPPLVENQRVRTEFLAAAVGDEIRKNCPTISARMFVVLRKAHELDAYARALGYTTADITAMRKSPENRAELRALRDGYLSQNGVVKGDTDSYCRLGLQEIQKGSLIGSLLAAR